MGCKDFAFMLAARPGCYIWIGNGPTSNGRSVHNARYYFNDEVLTLGANYRCTLVESILLDALNGAVTEAAWKTKPSPYLVERDDRMIQPGA
jgi:hypothetical protein